MDEHGARSTAFLCYNAHRPSERYSAPLTVKAALTLSLTRGHTLYSDEARLMATITADTYSGHDTIGGCCSAAGNRLLYGARDHAGCRENYPCNHGQPTPVQVIVLDCP